MNIKKTVINDRNEVVGLFEDNTSFVGAEAPGNLPDKKDKLYEIILATKAKQFKFESGGIMGNMSVDTGTKFCLLWHKINTGNFDEFIKSVNDFLVCTGESLTKTDIDRLQKEYNR
jgi:hypothetical protein